MRAFLLSLVLCALPLLLACAGGGGAPTPPPPGFTYRNPTGNGWLLLENAAASTPSHLVLDLVPPVQVQGGRGVALELDCGAQGVTWAKVAPEDPQLARNDGVYDLGAGLPVLLGRSRRNRLVAAALQKGRGHAAAYSRKPVLSLALDLAPGTPTGPVPLKVLKAYHLPADGDRETITRQVRVGYLLVGPASPRPGPRPRD